MQQVPSQSAQSLFTATLQHHRAGRLGDAERGYQRVLQMDPRHADALHFLGLVAQQTNRLALATDLIGRAIAINGAAPVFHNNLGGLLQAQGRSAAACASYARALRLKPDYAAAHYNLGLALQTQEKFAEAAAAYSCAISVQPAHAEAHGNLGNVLQAQGLHSDAIAAYRRALRLQPNFAAAHGNLANVLAAQGLVDDALAAYRQALHIQPTYIEAHDNLAILLLKMDRLDEAAAACRAALACGPESATTLTIFGNVLKEQGNGAQALAAYARALTLAPDCAEAAMGLAVGVLPIHVEDAAAGERARVDFERALDELTAWHDAHPGALARTVGSYQPFHLAYRPGNLCGPLSRYGTLMCATLASIAPRRPPQVTRDRLRLAIVCGQVRQHPVWDVILRGIVAHLDRRRIELLIYHTGSIVDAETHWAAGRADAFAQGPKPTWAWLAEISNSAPDVIFYPELGMDPAACALAARRLAPRQVAGWGHPVTTGLPTIDQFMSAELLEGPDADRHYRERLIRLPGAGVCTESAAIAPLAWDGPSRVAGVVRFALCQQPFKFDPADDATLARIAAAVGRCEFWLVAPQRHAWATTLLRERLARAFRAIGLDPAQHLRITPWMSRPQFLGFLDAMDIYLDSPGFSGYTTAWAAVHRGLPIVTLEGAYLRQRLAAGLLRQLGVTDGIATGHEPYVDTAVQWATECRDSSKRTARRAALSAAAPRADHNHAAVRAFEHAIAGSVS